jgi:hypothetical protein
MSMMVLVVWWLRRIISRELGRLSFRVMIMLRVSRSCWCQNLRDCQRNAFKGRRLGGRCIVLFHI